MCLVCPTPCTVRLGSTGDVPTCPCWYSYWYPFVQCFAWSAGEMYLFARARTRTGTRCTVLRWSARAMNLFARVFTCAVCESLHSVYCVFIPCTVLRLVRTGNVPTCPCSYSYWYLLCSAYLPVVVLVLMSARVMYLLARVRTRTVTFCAVLRLDSTGNVPICPWSYSYWYLLCSGSLGQHGLCTYVPVLVSLYSVRAVLLLDSAGNVPTCPWSYSYWYLLCSGSLGQHGLCTYVPVLVSLYSVRAVLRLDSMGNVPTCPWSYSYQYLLCSASLEQHGLCTYVPALVSLYSVLLWVIRTMYVSSCLDSRTVLVALLLLIWTVCW